MGRGKHSDTTQTKKCTVRLSKTVAEGLERVGGGSQTEGIRMACEDYMARLADEHEDCQSIITRVQKHIHAPESPALREKYFLFIDAWLRSENKEWNAPRIYDVMGITKTNSGVVKRSLKLLVHNRFVHYSHEGFKPVIRCNGGWTQDEFDIQFEKYIQVCNPSLQTAYPPKV